MLAVTYYGGLSDVPITEYLVVLNQGYAGEKAQQMLIALATKSQASLMGATSLPLMVEAMNKSVPPSSIEFKKDGKFFRVIKRSWK